MNKQEARKKIKELGCEGVLPEGNPVLAVRIYQRLADMREELTGKSKALLEAGDVLYKNKRIITTLSGITKVENKIN